ncbi:hypothetical protein VOLCADRAFT_98220 [Volvox carteri f. nagariensis]|uniref:CID domain-containing protein n=1 Tax=Volvox carteri f. nagariensis TaxID=3068 RepID=D8UES2_VOLCA|nr:uncharacterized protein VOLCADRAFT_98220 [Volvox carteri f. nagariensis]EFJ41822.1 hypothetical protein VOLCADRAFT_98220 [Volvox carteri f. nagariensis]|eukprot:XP_002957168.1 hypothetical protein VOLCADRAFT_98220 [Volvox carteri f. nagariensis]
MSGGGMNVNRESLVSRLQSLNVSQQSIEGTSKWCLFYIKDAKSVVNIWVEEFGRTTTERRIAFLYLANHILQEGRKKGREFADEFFRVLPKALASVSRSSDAKLRNSAKRLVDIWDERKVFGSAQVRVLKEHLNGGGGSTPSKSNSGGTGGNAGADNAVPSTGNDLDRRKLAAVGSLADVLYEVANAAARSSEWQTKCLQIKADLASMDASLTEVAAARTTLATALECLKAESERRKKAVTYIRMHLSQQTFHFSNLHLHPQEDSLKRTEDAHAALTAQKGELDERHAALLKQEQEQQEREQRERELEEALQQQQQQQEKQQQELRQQQEQQQQQQQQPVAMGGMGTDGPPPFLGLPPGGLPGMPPMMPPPFPMPGMDPSAPPFGLPGMPPFPAALLGPMTGMNPLGPLPPFLSPMPGMNLNMPHPPGMNPMTGPGGPMNPMGGGGGGGGAPPGGGTMGQLVGGLPDLAGALSALSATGFGGVGGGGDSGTAGPTANGSQPPQQQQLQPQSSGGGMPQVHGQALPGPQGSGGLPHSHGGPGQTPPQQMQQPGIDQLAAALANNSDQTAMLLANAFASMSQHHPLPPQQQANQGMGISGGFGGSPMGNGDGDPMDAPYDPEFPD